MSYYALVDGSIIDTVLLFLCYTDGFPNTIPRSNAVLMARKSSFFICRCRINFK